MGQVDKTYSQGREKFVEKADEAIAAVGDKISSAGSTVREQVPAGKIGDAVDAMASKLEAGGKYLEEHGSEDILHDVTRLVKRHPLQALSVGLGVGIVIGRILKRR